MRMPTALEAPSRRLDRAALAWCQGWKPAEASPQKRSSMPLDWTPFVNLVRSHQRFLLTTHVRPDGDGLGSMLALADVLQERGKSVQMVVASTLPPRYDFLDPDRRVRQFAAPGDAYRTAEVAV